MSNVKIQGYYNPNQIDIDASEELIYSKEDNTLYYKNDSELITINTLPSFIPSGVEIGNLKIAYGTVTITLTDTTFNQNYNFPTAFDEVKSFIYSKCSGDLSIQIKAGSNSKNDFTVYAEGEVGATCKINWLAIGVKGSYEVGRNLIILTDALHGYPLADGTFYNTSLARTPKEYIKVKPGEQYVLSISYSNIINNAVRLAQFDESKNFVGRLLYAGGETEGDVKVHYITIPDNVYYIWPGFNRDAKVKLEKGTVATPWTPAPEDVEA